MDRDGEIDERDAVRRGFHVDSAHQKRSFEVAVGRFIRLSSDQYRTTAYAAIRSRTTGADGVARIHVEFVDKQWPL